MEGSWKHPVTEAEVSRIDAEIDRQGYTVLKNYVSEQELKPARDLALSAVKAAGEYVCFTRCQAFAAQCSPNCRDPTRFKCCRRLYKLGTETIAPNVRSIKYLDAFRAFRFTHSSRFTMIRMS